MSTAQVVFFADELGSGEAAPGQERWFGFTCPNSDGFCGRLLIAGRTDIKRDGQNANGGVAQWNWDGNRDAPTFAPSINCSGCWHGYIRAGRCVDVAGRDEP